MTVRAGDVFLRKATASTVGPSRKRRVHKFQRHA
jgi:hypothetical protein